MINISSISKEYVMGDNKLLALNNVDVSIKEGEFVSIMGSSGSGKSTLMNIIGCLDVPSNGDYFFRENNISKFSSNKLAELRNKDMLVRIDTKNWLGNYNSTVKQFQNQQHLDNYLSKCYTNESYSKIIGISTLQS